MKSKENVPEEDVNEMIEEYRNLFVTKSASAAEEEPTIIYKGKLSMNQPQNNALKIDFRYLYLSMYLLFVKILFSDFIAMLQKQRLDVDGHE